MAAINDLISRIKDSELRSQIEKEVKELTKQKKFGLVFENHVPELTLLYDSFWKESADHRRCIFSSSK